MTIETFDQSDEKTWSDKNTMAMTFREHPQGHILETYDLWLKGFETFDQSDQETKPDQGPKTKTKTKTMTNTCEIEGWNCFHFRQLRPWVHENAGQKCRQLEVVWIIKRKLQKSLQTWQWALASAKSSALPPFTLSSYPSSPGSAEPSSEEIIIFFGQK